MNQVFTNISIEKQEKVVKAAFEEFANYGYENASTNRLIKNLDISKGSLFKYFSSKDELFQYLVGIACEKLIGHIEQVGIKKGFWVDVFMEYAESEFDFLIEEPTIYSFFYRMVEDINKPELSHIKEKLIIQSSNYLDRIFSLVVWGEPRVELKILMNHVTYILNGHNKQFIDVNLPLDHKSKKMYLANLKSHFEIIQKGIY